MTEWTAPADVSAQLQRLWDKGKLLAARLENASLFPLPVRIKGPDRRALSNRFGEVQNWIRTLDESSRVKRGFGYDLAWTEISHRQLGANRVPTAIVVPTEADALQLIGKRRAAERFDTAVAATLAAVPQLRSWIARRPMQLLENLEAWDRIIAVVAWLRDHPRPGIYLRQVDVPGVDTKFIESRRGLFAELLDAALPEDVVDAGGSSFEARYGFRTKPTMIRLRILDGDCSVAGLTDLSISLDQLAAHELLPRRVFITENEINGLAFPALRDAMVVFGLGYGLDRLAEIPWLRSKDIVYWGDIDTHGYAMLNQLRAYFPATRSVLMDRDTLLAHRGSWVEEPRQHPGPLRRLTPDEVQVFNELIDDRLGPRVRLEQERVGYSRVAAALAQVSARAAAHVRDGDR